MIQYTASGYYSYGCTVSTLTVKDVYKGDLKAGDQVKLAEQYCFDTGPDGTRQLYYEEMYGPSTPGREYIFFLGKVENKSSMWHGMYFPYCFEKSRYPILDSIKAKSVDSLSNQQLNLAPGESGVYLEMYKEVLAKYR